MAEKPIYVTQPDLPPLEELRPYLERIWESRVLTNRGPFQCELEAELGRYLGVEHLSLFTNGTIALVAALQALRIAGEVITTPFSFVATAHALLWNGIRPVFVDIDPVTLNLDPRRIEEAITPRTSAILPVHCYGTPCAVDDIRAVADRRGLRVIYDAAHAFGVRDQGGSLVRHGDVSVLSFHATKVFNTFEGGAVVCRDAPTKLHVDQLKNFGFVNETTVVAAGINGKMNEFSSALGLVQLRHVNAAIARRREIDGLYRELLRDLPGITVLERPTRTELNFSYFPIFVDRTAAVGRDELYEELKRHGIHGRRYFYPLISEFPMYRDMASARSENLPVASAVAQQVLCLPIYPALADADVERVTGVLRAALRSR